MLPIGVMMARGTEVTMAAIAIRRALLLLTDPSGDSLQMTPLLMYIPFKGFALVGAWLLTVFGIFAAALGVVLWLGRVWVRKALSFSQWLRWFESHPNSSTYGARAIRLKPLVVSVALAMMHALYRPSDTAYFT